MIALLVLLAVNFCFAVYKNFTAIDVHTIHETKVIENKINEFLITFFKLYPTATEKELSYYVNDGVLQIIGKG